MKKLLKVIAVIGFVCGLGITGVSCSNIETQDFSAKNSVIECKAEPAIYHLSVPEIKKKS